MSQSPFNFSFILQGRFSDEEQMNLSDSLIEAGCDYPEVSAHNDIITLEFFNEGINDNFQGVILEEMKRV
ncbi:hypothetical protein, partial [Endozoicomonas sp.]|uniref:hypothetical protein n=1 Tax=Endozoicomonas sp. TaxID=1892382 RepID=UPI003839E28F